MADSNSMRSPWSCHICLEESQNPVCTSCGHLFCWPCLYPWVHDMNKPCPVCRASLNLDTNIIPVYVSSQAEVQAPQAAAAAAAAATIPPRPQPRAPTTSVAAARVLDPNALIHMYRETLEDVRLQETLERARVAREEEEIAEIENLLNVDAWSLGRMRRELILLRRRDRALVGSSAVVSETGQTSGTRNSLSAGVLNDIDRAHGTRNALSDGVLDDIDRAHRTRNSLSAGVLDDIDRAHGTDVLRRVLHATVWRLRS